MNLAARSYCFLVAVIAATGCATTSSTRAPTVHLDIPARFQTSLRVAHFQAGEDVLHDPLEPTRAIAPMTRNEGSWGPITGRQAGDHRWTIDVYNIGSAKTEAAYAHAKDGYEADLDERVGFLFPKHENG